ncbi:hypothetical protein UVI_02045060 [Ustilaginoidea virens]|nr:hypothetical protein UVI_02045060 [Ustilaginoidea virens]
MGKPSPRDALFGDAPLSQTIPGALHQADDEHIERLIGRHGAVSLVRQIAGDLAQRDAQLAAIRRRADQRERALRKIIRECGLSNMDLENRLKIVELEFRSGKRQSSHGDHGLSGLMSDAMQDSMTMRADGEGEIWTSTLRLGGNTDATIAEAGKSTLRGWKDYLWGVGTVKRATRANGDDANPTAFIRARSNMGRRPAVQEDLFTPPAEASITTNMSSSSRASSVHSAAAPERKSSTSLASLALRLVAGAAATPGAAESRGRAASASARAVPTRAGSSTSTRTAQSARSASMAAGNNPKALMAMRKTSQTPQALSSATSLGQDAWASMASSPPNHSSSLRQESYGPVELDAIVPPESQPPTLNYTYNNNRLAAGEFLTDRFGFIYDQRRKKKQQEAAAAAAAAAAAHHEGSKGSSRSELLASVRNRISPILAEDLPSPKDSVSSGARPGSPNSHEERAEEDGKPKRWQDYLKIATFPTELLSHTPRTKASTLQVLEGTGSVTPELPGAEPAKGLVITATNAGLMPPQGSATTAVDNSGTPQPSETDSTAEPPCREETEPVKILLEQLSEVHDSLQRDKTVKWNDFLRKVRAERRREGQAAVAAAAAAAEARHETPAMILPETRVANGEMIGIAGLGNKGKVGRAKWNEFKALVLGGIPVAYRAKVWSECSGAAALRVPGYFEDLVARDGHDDDPAVVGQIQMDIDRTLTDNVFFRKGPGVPKLRQLLLAYSRRNKDVGYCQGMNLIAANLLLIMPSVEDAFWVLASVIESILPHGYYDHSLMASRADQQVLRQFVSTVLPKLSGHLDSLSVELEALTFQWFLSVFTDCLCAEALFRVWDVVLCTNDGSTFLFQIALALLKLNERNLLRCDTPAGVYTYINHHMTEHAISIDGLIQAGDGLRRVVRREDVELRRSKAIQAERAMVAARDEARSSRAAAAADAGAGQGAAAAGPDEELALR